jgi:hypothetical protein
MVIAFTGVIQCLKLEVCVFTCACALTSYSCLTSKVTALESVSYGNLALTETSGHKTL